jgi:rfaE bifunctional protein nucleotidyltransferase chain/domain
MGQIIPITQLDSWREKQTKKIVATNGCFDILHIGHLRYLTQAKKLGDILVIGLNGDTSVHTLKGEGRPINNESDRAELLASLQIVDIVTIFSEPKATNFLNLAKPHIYVKGGDYTEDKLDKDEANAIKKNGGTIKILPLTKEKSTTNLIEKIQNI